LLFRFAKAMKMVQPMNLLISTIAASVLSLFWSMCILFMFMLVSAILVSQTLQQFIDVDTNDMDMRLWCEHYYGDVMKALWTMFLITMSGGWPNWVSPLVHEISVVYALYFGAYVTLVAGWGKTATAYMGIAENEPGSPGVRPEPALVFKGSTHPPTNSTRHC